MGSRLDVALGVLNGALGDYLERASNGLATPMELLPANRPLADGVPLPIEMPRSRVVVLLHGLMGTEATWAFSGGEDYGSLLARDLDFTPLYLRYNTGLPIHQNARRLDRTLEALVDEYPAPLEEIVLLGHSMGGLLARSACHLASVRGSRWLRLVRRAIYLGTPHRGAPLERLGRTAAKLLQSVDNPYTRLVGEIADLRSDGIKNLGDANLFAEEAAAGARGQAPATAPMVPGIRHLLIAGTVSSNRWLGLLFGDAMVPLSSATDGTMTAKVFPGVLHLSLARHPEVYATIRGWCQEQP
jgi:pimeloyl-ACP methyl ester carboxylesterase